MKYIDTAIKVIKIAIEGLAALRIVFEWAAAVKYLFKPRSDPKRKQ